MIPPLVSGGAAPLRYVAINDEWLSILIGLCQDTLLRPQFWDGSDTDIAQTLDDVDDLVYQLMSGYSRVGMFEWHILETLPSNLLVCNGSLLERVDYPVLYDAIDPVFHVDADHFQLPDLRDKFIKIEHSEESLGAGGGNKTTTLTAANHAPHHHAANTGLPGTPFFVGQSNGGSQTTKSQIIPTSTATDTRVTAFGNTADQGSATPFSNEPQYVTLGIAIIAL